MDPRFPDQVPPSSAAAAVQPLDTDPNAPGYQGNVKEMQVREVLVATARIKMLGKALSDCFIKEGVNAPQKCQELRGMYARLVLDKYKGVMFPPHLEPEGDRIRTDFNIPPHIQKLYGPPSFAERTGREADDDDA